jgi:hypothetical protein
MSSRTRTPFSHPGTFLLGAAVVAIALTILAMSSVVAQPQDATSAGSSAPMHPAVDNTSRTSDLVVTSSTNTVITSAVMNLGTNSHGCEVTASAEVDRTVNTTGTYVFSIGLGGTTSTTSSERRLEFVATADTDVIWGNATTAQGFDSLTGSQTFNFLVRKEAATTPDTTVTNATITVVCADAQL